MCKLYWPIIRIQSDDDSHSSQGKKKQDKKSKEKNQNMLVREQNQSAIEVGNIFTKDKNKLDIILTLNSTKLLSISDKFNIHPDQAVTCDEFIEIMVSALQDTRLSDKDDFLQQLVDLFYRCKKTTSKTLKFQQLTEYMIEHEIEVSQTETAPNLKYIESNIKDNTIHTNPIEKIFFFEKINKIVMFESAMRNIKIFEAKTMKTLDDIECPSVILAVEFCHQKNAIAVSLADRTIVFFDTLNQNNKIVRRIHVPSTQKCLTYVLRQNKNLLFSAGVDGTIFAWNLDLIFSNEFSQIQQIDQGKEKSSESQQKDKEKKEYINFISERTPWFVPDIILCLIDLKNINLLASGSYDKKIRLWDLRNGKSSKTNSQITVNQAKQSQIQKFFDKKISENLLEDFTKQPIKELCGHQKAVRELAYSEKHKILVSCGFDFEVFVWNPYLEEKIMRLDGHEHPLVGVNVISSLNCFITADQKGMVNVWSILDYSCLQTFYVNVSQVTCIRAVPKHRQLICGSRQFKVFEFQKPFQHEYSDDNPITCAKFSKLRLEIYVASERSVKVWCARTGKPVKVIKNVFDSDITSMELDQSQRKMVLGSNTGDIKIFDLASGISYLTFDQHDPQEGEISFIAYVDNDNTVITGGWDKVIKVHMDERKDGSISQDHAYQSQPSISIKQLKQITNKNNKAPQENSRTLPNIGQKAATQQSKVRTNIEQNLRYTNLENLLRGRTDAHSNNITCGDFAMHLDLIATGGRDNKARIWDYERIMQLWETPENYHQDEVIIVKFIDPFPLLITSDSSGLLYIWLTKPHPNSADIPIKPVVDWRNNYTLQSNCPITAIDTYYDKEKDQLIMLIGDEMGTVRIQDITQVLRQTQTQPIKEVKLGGKRNPYRIVELAQNSNQTKFGEKENQYLEQNNTIFKKIEPVVNESQIIQISQWQPHTDQIRSIQYINITDEPLVLTASRDKFVKIFTMQGEELGCLKQGYLMLANYKWDFQISNFDDQVSQRQSQIQSMLDGMKNEEGNDKRREKIELNRQQFESQQGFFQTNPKSTGSIWGDNQSQNGNQSLINKPFDSRASKSQSVARLIQKGKNLTEMNRTKQTYNQMMALKPQTSALQRRVTFQDFQLKQQQRQQKIREQLDCKIGPFKFDYDDDIESEVLCSQMVYADLKELDEILGKSALRKTSTSMRIGRKK